MSKKPLEIFVEVHRDHNGYWWMAPDDIETLAPNLKKDSSKEIIVEIKEHFTVAVKKNFN
jgi:hypothetical protein